MQYKSKKADEKDMHTVQYEPYLSQENAFIRFITQLDPIPDVIDAEFLKKYYRNVLFSGKIKGLSFITNPKTIKLNSLQRMNMSMEIDAGLYDLADETMFDNIDICQVTRGTKGNLQNAMITQRKEFKLASEGEQVKNLLGRLMKGKKDKEEPLGIQEAY